MVDLNLHQNGWWCTPCQEQHEFGDICWYWEGDDNDYGFDGPPTKAERDAADEAFDNEVIARGY